MNASLVKSNVIEDVYYNKSIPRAKSTLRPHLHPSPFSLALHPSPFTLTFTLTFTLHPHPHAPPFTLTRCRTTTSSPSVSSTSGLTGASTGTPSMRWCAATRARSTLSPTWSRTSSAQSRACRPRSGAHSPAREKVSSIGRAARLESEETLFARPRGRGMSNVRVRVSAVIPVRGKI